jgi:hypothetical protein
VSEEKPRKVQPLVEVGLGVAWLIGVAAALKLVDLLFGPAAMGTALVGAVLADLAAGRAGVRWAAEGIDWREGARRAGVGAAIAAGVVAVVVGIAAALRWFHNDGVGTSAVLLFAIARAIAVAARDELVLRGIPLVAAARAGVPEPYARAFAAIASGAAIALVPGVTIAAVAMAIASGWLFAALWTRGRGAYAAVGAHAGWVLGVGSVLHGGLLDTDWTIGNFALGASAAGPPAWLAAAVLSAAAIAVSRSGSAGSRKVADPSEA